jgi:hypothetical protein
MRVREAGEAGMGELRDLAARGELGRPPDLARYSVRESLPGPNWRFAEMLRRLGIRRRPGNEVRLTMLGTRCTTCTSVNECEAWLASGRRVQAFRGSPAGVGSGQAKGRQAAGTHRYRRE